MLRPFFCMEVVLDRAPARLAISPLLLSPRVLPRFAKRKSLPGILRKGCNEAAPQSGDLIKAENGGSEIPFSTPIGRKSRHRRCSSVLNIAYELLNIAYELLN